MLTQATESRELVLADLVDEIMRRMQAGEPIDIAALTKQHPDLAGRLGELQPAVQLLAELRQNKELFAEANSIAANAASVQPRREHLQPGGEITSVGVLGDFRLVREVGRGGMGVVFEAEQISLGRTVALKMLPYAGVLDEKHLLRFKNEARAAATLEHPHIVPVYSIGCERGVHFFTMRFIEGQSLADVLQAIPTYRAGVLEAAPSQSGLASQLAKLLDSTPQGLKPPSADAKSNLSSSKLDTQRVVQAGITTDPVNDSPAYIHNVARLGIQAAEALAYAHERGILHRDVKPGNLLLDVQGDLWVADFGLARLEQDAGITITGDVLGTLRYMSPEQALGQTALLDERADVYSLGVTLYEMFTLRPAFAGRDRQEILRRIATEEPQPPRQIDPRIPRDLETIVLKAMGKEVAGRYQTAGQLADDLRRYLDHRPIQARRPTLVEKVVKWSRRHPAAMWATVLVFLATTVISAGSALLITSAYHQEAASAQKARDAADAASKASRDEATQRRQAEENARRAAAVSTFMVNAFRSPDPGRDGRTITVAEVLGRAVKEAREQFADDPRLQANLLEAIGETYVGLGLWSESVPVFETVRDLRKTIPGIDWVQLLEVEENLAKMYACTGRIPEAIKMEEEQLQLIQSKMGPTHRATINAMGNLAETYLGACRFDEAVALQEKTLELKKSKLGPDDPDTLTTSRNLGETYLFAGKFPEGVALLEQTFKREQALLGAGTNKLPGSSQALADAYIRVGRSPEAILLLEPLCDSNRRRLGPHHLETIRSNNSLVEAYRDSGRIDEATALAEETHKLCQEFVSPSDRLALDALTNLASVYQSQGRIDQALALYQQALANAKSVPGNPQTVEIMTSLGKAFYTAGRINESLPLLTEVLQINKAELGPQNINTVESMDDLALADLDAGRLDEAVPLFEETNQFWTNKLGRDNQITITSTSNLAEAYIVANRGKEAEPLARECLKTLEQTRPDEWQTYFVRVLLGAAILGQKNDIEAEPLLTLGYQGIHERVDKIADDDKPLVKKAVQQIVRMCETTNQPEKAALWKERLKDFDNSDGKQKSDEKAAAATTTPPLNPKPQP